MGPGRGKGKSPVGVKAIGPRRLEWRVTEVVEDERGVKRCVVVQQQAQQPPPPQQR